MNPASENRTELCPAFTVLVGILLLLLLTLYGPLNIARMPLHSLALPLDSRIPFVGVFVVPYLSYFLYLLVAVVVLWRRQKEPALARFLLAAVLVLAAAYVTYAYFQTVVERPDVAGADLFSRMVRYVYHFDQPYNVFPSLHAALSTLAVLCLYRRTPGAWFLAAWGLLIAISTVFVKQHYVLDVLAGAALAVAAFSASRHALPVTGRPATAE